MKLLLSVAVIVIATLVALSSCSSVSQQSTEPAAMPATTDKPHPLSKPATAPVAAPAETQMEGGIVGTGNENECAGSNNKNCNDNVK